MVVARGVDQVADDLARAPGVGGGTDGCPPLVGAREQLQPLVDRRVQGGGDGGGVIVIGAILVVCPCDS